MTAASNGVICFGEMLLRLSAPRENILLHTPELAAHFGGAEANVAVALARLGQRAAMITRIPDNIVGDAAIEVLQRHGVDVTGIARAQGRLGVYYLAPGAGLRASSIVYDRAGSVFERSVAKDFDWPTLFADAAWFHMSGITPALSPQAAELALHAVRAARSAGLRISFDGNYRGHLWSSWDSDPRSILSALVSEVNLLIGNHRDIGLLLDRTLRGDSPDHRRDAAVAAFDAFPRLDWIASTARRVESADHHFLSARLDGRGDAWQTDEIEIAGIIDRIGTGDAFAAGILKAIVAETPGLAAQGGLALAALKHFIPGDFSLTRAAELNAFLDGHRDVQR